ncbi:hypothetical protein C8R43DRAFT_849046, partial [Mycena crocata]
HLKLFPRTFAEGTAAKSHKTITVDAGDYDTSLEPTTDSFEINLHDAKRVPSGAPWKYLTDRPLKPGPVHVAVRGKCLVITAGHHALVCHFTLEGNMKILKRADFDEMVSTCVPGNNPNAGKAGRLRSFPLLKKFIEPGARQKLVRKINILAAIVMDEDIIIISDFTRMTQVHVV